LRIDPRLADIARRRRLSILFLPLVVAVLVASGCGGSGSSGSSNQLIVSAASSLQDAFTTYAQQQFPNDDVKQSFAGSDDLAAQIRQGLRPDVYASADATLPEQLYRENLVEKPRIFAGNELVIAVPRDSSINSIDDLAKPGTTLVIGDPSVPVGSYTRDVFGRLSDTERKAILANVRSEEPEVSSVVGKVTEGAADAAFVYVTDVKAAGGDLRAIHLPGRLQPVVAYGISIVRDAPNPELAKRFVAGLLNGGPGEAILRQEGFLPPP
jgi:molybdate transport system substrate-binding protein